MPKDKAEDAKHFIVPKDTVIDFDSIIEEMPPGWITVTSIPEENEDMRFKRLVKEALAEYESEKSQRKHYFKMTGMVLED